MEYLHEDGTPFTKEEFLQKLKTDKEFNDEFGSKGIDQISELIRQLKDNPDSRRLMVNAWNVGELDQMVLPPCHYGFQVYTRELSDDEQRAKCHPLTPNAWDDLKEFAKLTGNSIEEAAKAVNIPTRAISLMWNQRSVDTFLGLPFNIASYGLLLEIIAKEVNMVPDELIGNLGDVHLYSNHIEQAKEQIGREYTLEERINIASTDIHFDPADFGIGNQVSNKSMHATCDLYGAPRRTREPFPLPKLMLNPIFLANLEHKGFDEAINGQVNFELENYQSHPTIKAPLSN